MTHQVRNRDLPHFQFHSEGVVRSAVVIQKQYDVRETIATLQTEEAFDAKSDSLVGYTPADVFRLKIWEDDWLRNSKMQRRDEGTDRIFSFPQDLLTSNEEFPPHLDMDDKEIQAIVATAFPWWKTNRETRAKSQEISKRYNADIFTAENQVATVGKKPSGKRKSAQISSCPPVTRQEVADWILGSMQRISHQPSLYSLLRAWVLQDDPHQRFYRPKRPSLLDYARRATRNSKSPEEYNKQPYSWSSFATVDGAPPMDVLRRLKTSYSNGRKSYVCSQHDHLCQLTVRNDRKHLLWALHRKNARQAKRLLVQKGIVLQTP